MKIIHKNLLYTASNLKQVHENVQLLKDKFSKYKLQTQGIDIKNIFHNNTNTNISNLISNQSNIITNINNTLLLGSDEKGQTLIGPSPF
jgi:hypothetical protein